MAHDTASLNKARYLFINNSKLAAFDICNNLISSDSNFVEAYVLRGGIQLDLDLPSFALIDFNTAIRKDPENFNAIIGKGMYYRQIGDFEESSLAFNKAEKINDTALALFLNRSMLYNKMQNYDLNIMSLSQGLKYHPKELILIQNRSYAYICKHQYDSAVLDALSALAIDSNDIVSKTNLGFCYISKKQYLKALAIYRNLNINSESHPYLQSNYGFVLFKTGKKIEGLNHLYNAIKEDPKNSYAHKYMAEISIEENDIEMACYHIGKALNLGYTKMYGKDLEILEAKYCR